MNWKYLILATVKIGHVKINLQFELAAGTITEAEFSAAALLTSRFDDVDIFEIRRI